MQRIQLNKKEENIKKLNQKENEIKNINDTLTYEKNYKVTFKDTSKDILTITLKDYEISFKLLGKEKNNNKGKELNYKQAKQIDALKLSYQNIMDNEDIEYEIMQDDNIIKENIVIKENNKESYQYEYEIITKNLEVKLNEEASKLLFVNNKGKIIYTMLPPEMKDSNNNKSDKISYEIEQEEDNKYTCKIIASKNWINDPNRKCPIYLDPSIQVNEQEEKEILFTRKGKLFAWYYYDKYTNELDKIDNNQEIIAPINNKQLVLKINDETFNDIIDIENETDKIKRFVIRLFSSNENQIILQKLNEDEEINSFGKGQKDGYYFHAFNLNGYLNDNNPYYLVTVNANINITKTELEVKTTKQIIMDDFKRTNNETTYKYLLTNNLMLAKDMLTNKLSLTINSFLMPHTYNKDNNFPFKELFKELFKEYGENIKIKYSMLVFCKGIENKNTNSYDKRYVLVDGNNNYKEYIESEDKYYFMYEDKKEYSYLYDSQEKLTIEENKIKIESKENILTFVKMKKYNCYILLQIEDKKSKEKITINYDATNQYIQNIQDDKGNEYTFNYNANQKLKNITFNEKKIQNYEYENNMLSSISYEDKKMQFNYKNNQFIYNDSNCECKNIYTIISDNNLHVLKDNQEYLKTSLEDDGKLFKVTNEENKTRYYLLDTNKEKVINQYEIKEDEVEAVSFIDEQIKENVDELESTINTYKGEVNYKINNLLDISNYQNKTMYSVNLERFDKKRSYLLGALVKKTGDNPTCVIRLVKNYKDQTSLIDIAKLQSIIVIDDIREYWSFKGEQYNPIPINYIYREEIQSLQVIITATNCLVRPILCLDDTCSNTGQIIKFESNYSKIKSIGVTTTKDDKIIGIDIEPETKNILRKQTLQYAKDNNLTTNIIQDDTYTYDDNNLLKKIKNKEGLVKEYSYQDGKITNDKIYQEGNPKTYKNLLKCDYDSYGYKQNIYNDRNQLVVSMLNQKEGLLENINYLNGNKKNYLYNNDDSLKEINLTTNNIKNYKCNFTYSNKEENIIVNDNLTYNYQYDENDNLSKVSINNKDVCTINNKLDNKEDKHLEITYPNNYKITYYYDEDDNLLNITKNNQITFKCTYNSNGTINNTICYIDNTYIKKEYQYTKIDERIIDTILFTGYTTYLIKYEEKEDNSKKLIAFSNDDLITYKVALDKTYHNVSSINVENEYAINYQYDSLNNLSKKEIIKNNLSWIKEYQYEQIEQNENQIISANITKVSHKIINKETR